MENWGWCLCCEGTKRRDWKGQRDSVEFKVRRPRTARPSHKSASSGVFVAGGRGEGGEGVESATVGPWMLALGPENNDLTPQPAGA